MSDSSHAGPPRRRRRDTPRPALVLLLTLLLALTAMAVDAAAAGCPTTVTTTLSGESKEGATLTVLEGAAVKDQAALSGANSGKAGGTVSYNVYSDSACKTLVAKAGEVTVSSGKVPASSEEKLSVGTYYWQASYKGDEANQPGTSTCGNEVETVKTSTSLSTTLSGESKEGEAITVGESSGITDQAALSGTNAGKAGGTVAYDVYSDSECKILVAKAGEVTVSSGKVPASNEEKLSVGTYYWQATYKGDSSNEGSISACGKEISTVKAKTSTKLSTTLLGEKQLRPEKESESEEEEEPEAPYEGTEITVAEGAAVADTAKLSGTNAATAGGTLKYDLYSDKECKKLVGEVGEGPVSDGVLPESNEEKLSTGTYYWQVKYSGDALNAGATSTCGAEITVVKAATALTTTLSGEGKEGAEITVTEGAAVSDKATLGGTDAAMATGTVKYALYSDYECTQLVAEAGEAKVAGEFVPASSKETLAAGAYYWQAGYSGDSVNHSSTTSCGAEILIVIPPLTTSLTGEGESGEQLEVVKGAGVIDKAKLHGEHAATATGTVKYALYSDSECKTLVAKAGEVTVSGENVPSSKEETPTQGIYYWQASYSGDVNNPAHTTVCGEEVDDVTTSTSLSTSLSGEGKKGGKIEVAAGIPAGDEATLSGTNASKAEGNVEYNAYSDSQCKELAALAGEVKVAGGSVPASEQEKLAVGTYYWQATYLGDGVNHTSTSSCGSEVETVTAPITISAAGEGSSGNEIEVAEGAAVSIKATLHGENAAKATGTVKYKLYADDLCKELVMSAGEVTVKGASVPASEAETLAGGEYYGQAEYSGDANNPAAKSACGEEGSVQVRGPDGNKYAALGDSYSAGQGAGHYYAQANRRAIRFARRNPCHRTPRAWPALVAESIFGAAANVTAESEVFKQQPPSFIFRACSGAVTENLWTQAQSPSSGQWNEWISHPRAEWLGPTPAQALWLEEPGGVAGGTPNRAITRVTLTNGGNDAGFATIAANCVQLLSVRLSVVQRCQEAIIEWTVGGILVGGPRTFVSPPRAANQGGVESIRQKLPWVLAKIQVADPGTTIFVPLYPRVLKLQPRRDISVGLNLIINNSARGITSADALENFITTLNEEITKTVARWSGRSGRARVVPATVNAFAGHLLGDPDPWVKTLSSHVVESFHPTCNGQIALATQVVPTLGFRPLATWSCP